MREDLRGLFYIVKGNYQPIAPKVMCGDGVERFIGGYDPCKENGKEWYRVLDNEVFFCSYAGGDYSKALEVIKNQIVHFKSRKRYFKWVSEVSSEDYYFTHYLKKAPFTYDQHLKRCEGRTPRVSVAMKALEREILNEYGLFFNEDVEIIEDEAYDKIDAKEKMLETKRSKLKLKKPVGNLLKKEEKSAPERKIKVPTKIKKRIKLV